MKNNPRFSRRAVLGGVTSAAALSAASLVTVNAFASSAREVPQPEIFPCADWQARPPASEPPRLEHRPNKIIVHHTAFPNTEDLSKEYAFQNSRDIQDLHMDDNGWIDSGQHFTNSRGGFVTEGRHGSLDALLDGSYMMEGTHCVGQNDQGIGIENDGSYHEGDEPTAEQWDSLIAFCAFICFQYELPSAEIYGHMDFNDTLCPGGIHARLPELRDAVQQILDGA